jgi:ketosteroid isomerase-like protein
MSDSNEAAYRDGLAAWNANDWDAIERYYAPDAVVVAPPGWPEQETDSGWAAIRAQFERIKDTMDTERIDVIEVETDGDSLVGRCRWTGTSNNGLPFEIGVMHNVEFRDGVIARMEFFIGDDEQLAGA